MTARESYVPVQGSQLYVREIGIGSPLVVLHGGPDFNHTYLLPELDDLASAFRLIYYDQRGRGRSSAAVSPDDVTIESELDDLDRLRAHFGLTELSLLGHSWGSLLAMAYANRHPDHVSQLILMNSGPASHADYLNFREWSSQDLVDSDGERVLPEKGPPCPKSEAQAESGRSTGSSRHIRSNTKSR